MVQYYNIAGRKIGSHYLSIAVLSTVAALTTFAASGGEAKKTQTPPINASSSDEEKFIQDFLKQAQGEEKKAAH